jgi:hypothetical protein
MNRHGQNKNSIMKKNAGKTEAKAVLVVENLDQLTAIVNEPVMCEFTLCGQALRLPCRRVSQELDEQVRAIRREAVPMYKKTLGKDGDYDYMDPAYQAKRDLNEKIARSLTVYAGCPAIAAKKPGLTNKNEIHAFVKTILTEHIVELIFLTIQGGGMVLVDRANFISTAASES